MSSLIEMNDVWYQYNPDSPLAYWALMGVNLRIERGEFISIIGPTGSGKSTLIQHFNGLLKPAKGEVIVDGVNISRTSDLKSIRKNRNWFDEEGNIKSFAGIAILLQMESVALRP